MVDAHDRSDAALDRLITEALDVDVAPEFVAQVRTRLAAERTRTAWPVAWTLASATAVAAVVIVWLAYPVDPLMPTESARIPAENTTAVISRAPAPDASPVADTEPVGRNTGQTVARPERRVERMLAAAPVAPSIIVDAREAIALQGLVARLREGSLDPSRLPVPQSEPAVTEDTGILIQPITVMPLAFAADLQLELDVDLPQELEGLE